MKRKSAILPSLIVTASLLLSACIGLIPLEEEATTSEYGPQVSLTEHQTRTLDSLWTFLQDNYIYYETADVNWDAIHDEYQGRVAEGLTNAEFEALMHELEGDLPEGTLLYQSRTERIESDTTDNSSYEGIGAFVGFSAEPEPHIILLSIIEGSPAEKAGLEAHDSILAIDGDPVLLEEGLNAVERVRGPAGSTVTLDVKSPGRPQRSVKVQRGKLVSSARLQAYQIVGTNYGYLLFPPINYDTLMQDVVTAMQVFTTNRKLEGIILDLRIATPAGNWPLEELFTMFYKGEVGEFYNRSAKQMLEVEGQEVFNSQEVPLIILVGKNTNGFPEILAGSLQMHGRATVIGEATPGSIESSTPYSLPDGSRIFLATTSFLLPNGDDIGNNGVRPDVPVDAGWDEVLPDRDPVLDAAIQFLRTKP